MSAYSDRLEMERHRQEEEFKGSLAGWVMGIFAVQVIGFAVVIWLLATR